MCKLNIFIHVCSAARLKAGAPYFLQENAQKIAEFLASHPRVKKVNYAGLPNRPGRSLHYSQVPALIVYLIKTSKIKFPEEKKNNYEVHIFRPRVLDQY